MTGGRIFSDEEIRQQIAENYTRRGEYRDSYMTPEDRRALKDKLLQFALSINTVQDEQRRAHCLEAARLLVKEFCPADPSFRGGNQR